MDYINFKSNQLIETFPLASEFIFSNVYSTYKGDKRACEDTYYSNFDDPLIKGKLKSIGSSNYVWYSSFEKIGYGGALKSGARRRIINGVTYILQ